MEFEAVIGLETHVQLRTQSKMWCGCRNEYGALPNTYVCPVCLGMPGVLPVANREALRLTALTGLLLHCDIMAYARFDRKNYFYPDVPKNYQITQYTHPSTRNGYMDFEFEGKIQRARITRAHLEEDVGKSFHFEKHSGVDYNRAGVPLLEIVSEPDLRSAEMAYAYLSALKGILVYGGISDCDMEKGMVRCDVNVSIRPAGSSQLGQKVEIKNMNSFSGVRRALQYEIARQKTTRDSGGAIEQETRRWDDAGGITEPMRTKEDAHDYRYFPDPDLMPFRPSPSWRESVRSSVVEVPLARKQRFVAQYGLPPGDADVLVADVSLGGFFEPLARQTSNPKAVANWVINNLRAKLAETNRDISQIRFDPHHILALIELVEGGQISTKMAQQVFSEMFDSGKSPRTIVEEQGLAQLSDSGALEQYCDQVIDAHPKSVNDYRQGKDAALNFLKGQVMRLSKGKANPAMVGQILERKLHA